MIFSSDDDEYDEDSDSTSEQDQASQVEKTKEILKQFNFDSDFNYSSSTIASLELKNNTSNVGAIETGEEEEEEEEEDVVWDQHVPSFFSSRLAEEEEEEEETDPSTLLRQEINMGLEATPLPSVLIDLVMSYLVSVDMKAILERVFPSNSTAIRDVGSFQSWNILDPSLEVELSFDLSLFFFSLFLSLSLMISLVLIVSVVHVLQICHVFRWVPYTFLKVCLISSNSSMTPLWTS